MTPVIILVVLVHCCYFPVGWWSDSHLSICTASTPFGSTNMRSAMAGVNDPWAIDRKPINIFIIIPACYTAFTNLKKHIYLLANFTNWANLSPWLQWTSSFDSISSRHLIYINGLNTALTVLARHWKGIWHVPDCTKSALIIIIIIIIIIMVCINHWHTAMTTRYTASRLSRRTAY